MDMYDMLTSEHDRRICEFESYKGFIAGFEAAQRWIPVEEEMPEQNKAVNVIVLSTTTGKQCRTIAYFIPEKTILAADFLEDDAEDLEVYDENIDDYWVKEGWFEYQTEAETHWFISDKVTHWLPIPKLPTK